MDWQWVTAASVFITLLFALIGCFCLLEYGKEKWKRYRARNAPAMPLWPPVDEFTVSVDHTV